MVWFFEVMFAMIAVWWKSLENCFERLKSPENQPVLCGKYWKTALSSLYQAYASKGIWPELLEC